MELSGWGMLKIIVSWLKEGNSWENPSFADTDKEMLNETVGTQTSFSLETQNSRPVWLTLHWLYYMVLLKVPCTDWNFYHVEFWKSLHHILKGLLLLFWGPKSREGFNMFKLWFYLFFNKGAYFLVTCSSSGLRNQGCKGPTWELYTFSGWTNLSPGACEALGGLWCCTHAENQWTVK